MKEKKATRRRKKPAKLFKTGKRSAKKRHSREAQEWESILGPDVKAQLDARIKQTTTAGYLSPSAALYWQALLQERLQPCPTDLLRAAARSIKDGEALIQEIVSEVNGIDVEAGEAIRTASEEARTASEALHTWQHFCVTEARQKLHDATSTLKQKLQCIKAMRLTALEYQWLMLRTTPKEQQAKSGATKYCSQREIAKALGVSKQAVYRMERRLEPREDIREYLRQECVPPRDPKGSKVRRVTNRKKPS